MFFDVSNAMEFLAKCTEMQICTTFNITDRGVLWVGSRNGEFRSLYELADVGRELMHPFGAKG